MTKKVDECSICGAPLPNGEYGIGSNNAAPANNGRCCNECNVLCVLPVRLAHLYALKVPQ